ncbi:WD40 repeat domain-containing protein [Streptomyces sp. R-07]|uniref:WD40 repeat domain-containing protein n=1 Tax=Streptomyces sp. R-07 TaxID=3404052 RepID=UPI003CEE1554
MTPDADAGAPQPPTGRPSRRPNRRTLLFGALGTVAAAAAAVPTALTMSSSGQSGPTPPSRSPRPRSQHRLSRPLIVKTNFRGAYALAFSPDSKILAVGLLDGGVELWDPGTLAPTVKLRKPSKRYDGVHDLAFSRDGTLLAACDGIGTTLWNVAARKEIATLTDTEIDPVQVQSLAFHPHADVLACANMHATVNLWDTGTHEKLATLIDPIGYTKSRQKSVESVAFSRDGSTIATSHEARNVRFWDISTGEIIGTINGLELPVLHLAYSPDGSLLAGGTASLSSRDGQVKLWSADSQEEVATLTVPYGTTPGESIPRKERIAQYVNSVQFSPDGGTVIGSVNGDPLIVRWDVATRKVVDIEDARIYQNGADYDTAHPMRISPDGTMITAGLLSDVALWKLP